MTVSEWAVKVHRSPQTIRKWVFGNKYKYKSCSGIQRVLNSELEVDDTGVDIINEHLAKARVFVKKPAGVASKSNTNDFTNPSWWTDPLPECLKDKDSIFDLINLGAFNDDSDDFES